MMKTVVLSVAFALCTSSSRCVAQEYVVPVIYLSPGEIAKAKQIAQDLKSAQDRDSRARIAWQNFHQNYQAAHPEWPGLFFASDFRLALARKSSSGPLGGEVAAIELSAEDRQKAESLHREMLEARRGLDPAQKNWRDYKNELVADHVQSTGNGNIVQLPSGKSVIIPEPWSSGRVSFTPDFRVAVPVL